MTKEPCDFCDTIYPDDDTKNIVFGRGKYSDFNKDSFITIDDEGDYHVNIDPGDPYEIGYLCNIKFCPYCGRKLTEVESQEINLCDSCKTKGCIFQYGIVRSHCDFYKAESEDKECQTSDQS